MRRSDAELRALRDRFAGLDAAVALAESAAEAEARCVLRAVALQSEGAYPTAGGLFFSALPQVVTGAEKEGATPAFAAAAQSVYPYVPGSSAPAAGSRAVAALVPYRWALSGGGAAPKFTGTIRGCNNISTGVGVHTVTIKNGATTIWTGSTDEDGNYSGNGTLPSSVTVQVTPSIPNFASFSGTRSVNPTTKVIADVTLSAATGYHCACCVIPWPDTLHATTGGGAMTLTYMSSVPVNFGGPYRGWFGCLDLPLGTSAFDKDTGECGPASGDSPFPFAIVLDSNNNCGYLWGTYNCCIDLNTCEYATDIIDGFGNPVDCAHGNAKATSSFTSAGITVACDPLEITVHFQFSDVVCPGCNSSSITYALGPTITVTE